MPMRRNSCVFDFHFRFGDGRPFFDGFDQLRQYFVDRRYEFGLGEEMLQTKAAIVGPGHQVLLDKFDRLLRFQIARKNSHAASPMPS